MVGILRTIIVATFMAIVAVGASYAQDAQQALASASVIEQIKERGTLRVGVSTFVPWAMRSKDGELIGFEIDVAKKLAEDMGVQVEFVPTAFSGIIPALIAGKFDIIITGLTITPERNLTVNFSTPYSNSGQQMAANKELAKGFDDLANFNDSSVTITCRRGASSCNAIQDLFPKATLRRFDDDAQAFQEVVNGNAHAVVSSAPKPLFWTQQQPDKLFLPFEDTLTRSNEAFGVRKGDPDALNFLNNWVLVNSANGWLQQRHDHWFKTQEWAQQVAQQ